MWALRLESVEGMYCFSLQRGTGSIMLQLPQGVPCALSDNILVDSLVYTLTNFSMLLLCILHIPGCKKVPTQMLSVQFLYTSLSYVSSFSYGQIRGLPLRWMFCSGLRYAIYITLVHLILNQEEPNVNYILVTE